MPHCSVSCDLLRIDLALRLLANVRLMNHTANGELRDCLTGYLETAEFTRGKADQIPQLCSTLPGGTILCIAHVFATTTAVHNKEPPWPRAVASRISSRRKMLPRTVGYIR